jgi:hypothetical protein
MARQFPAASFATNHNVARLCSPLINGEDANCSAPSKDQNSSDFRLFMRGLWIPVVQKGREAFPQVVITNGGFVEQELLCVASQIRPQPNDGGAERVFEAVWSFCSHIHFG